MSAPVRKRGFLLHLAAESLPPVADGAPAVSAINHFGPPIVERWREWMRGQPPGLCQAAIGELADLSAGKARAEAVAVLDTLTPNLPAAQRSIIIEYLAALPRFAQRALVLDPSTGAYTLPHGTAADDPLSLLGLLPIDAPPCEPGSDIPGLPCRLTDLAGAGSLGTHYRGTDSHGETVLVKFCTDPALVALLRRHAEPLRSTGRWSGRLVRLLAFDLDQPVPFFICEHVPGGDLVMLLANLKHQTGRGFAPDEVLRLIEQIAEALAAAHELGLVHGDLKPANVLVSGEAIRLAECGIGIVTAEHALARGDIGSRPADQVRLVRGLASLPYLAPERRRGDEPEPRHDLYSLGVLWYQLLAGDLARPLGPGWADELHGRGVPAIQVALIERCVGTVEKRPTDAGALLAVLRRQQQPEEQHDTSIVSPEEIRQQRMRRENLLRELKALHDELGEYRHRKEQVEGSFLDLVLLGGWIVLEVLAAVLSGPGMTWLLLGAMAVLSVVVFWIYRRFRHLPIKRMFGSLQHRVARLERDYPDEVAAWGGPDALLNPALLAEALASFEEDTRTLSPELE